MAQFRYKAVNPQGETEEGEMDAVVESEVVTQLQESGYLPIRVEPKTTPSRWKFGGGLRRRSRRRLGARETASFTRELATLLTAKLPLDQSLETLIDIADDDALRRLATDVYDRVRDGASFSAALEAQQGAFSDLYLNMIRAGEASGALDATLARLADYLQRMRDLRESVASALTYPAILVVVAGVSVVVLLTFVIPQFSQMFEDMGAALPWPTKVVIAAGEILRGYWWTLLLLPLLAILVVRRWLDNPQRRLHWDTRALGVPLVGELITKVEIARFARTLGITVGNGVPLLAAMDIARGGMTNQALQAAVANAAESLKAGKGLATPLSESGLFPKLAVRMIRVGEESGQLEDMLLRVADVYDQETRVAVQRFLGFLEPALIVGLGVVIAGIIMSILVAVLSLNQLVF